MAKTASKATKKKRRKKRKKRKKLSQAEKLQRRTQRKLYREFRAFIRELGFSQIKSDKIEITVSSRPGEIDDIFIFENVLVLVEYTIGKPDSAHVLKKKPFFDNIISDVPGFLEIARAKYPELSGQLKGIYDDQHYHVRIMYVPLYEAAPETIAACPDVIFLQGGLKKYFFALSKTIERSARVEFFSYLKLAWNDIGTAAITASMPSNDYTGQLLPEAMSSFPSGFKVVSFYADPERLIGSAYVLRRDGWRDSSHLYQRILVRSKIKKMRRYLIDQKRVFVNNIIATLPASTELKELEIEGPRFTRSKPKQGPTHFDFDPSWTQRDWNY